MFPHLNFLNLPNTNMICIRISWKVDILAKDIMMLSLINMDWFKPTLYTQVTIGLIFFPIAD